MVPWDVLPVAGSGPPGGRVAIWGAGDAALHADVDERGHFCVDVPLAAGRPQRLRAELAGEEATLEVSRAVLPMLELDPGANAAPEGALGTSMGADAPLVRLLDGKRATGVELTSAWLDDDWLWLALPSPIVTDRIVVGADPACPLDHFVLHTTDRAVPGDPRTDADTWRHSAIETSWPVTEVGLGATPVRHVAISIEGPGCRLAATDEGAHRLVELQVWVAEAAPPVMAPPRCDR